METLNHALTLVSQHCLFCSLDLRDAYFSVHGVMYGPPVWYRALEKNKIRGLRRGKGDYESPVLLADEAKGELQWWRDNILSSHNLIDITSPC